MNIVFAPHITITINSTNGTRNVAFFILILKLLGFL